MRKKLMRCVLVSVAMVGIFGGMIQAQEAPKQVKPWEKIAIPPLKEFKPQLA